jgi:hypothetical protein
MPSSFTMFQKHKRTPAELATKLNAALVHIANGTCEKVLPQAPHP